MKTMMLSYLIIAGLCFWLSRAYRRRNTAVTFKDHTGERVVIFGASSGIGEQLALQYARRGARLVLVARREALLESVTSGCLSFPTCKQASYIVGDITQEADLLGIVAATKDQLDGCDTVVINAGILSILPFEQVCEKDTTRIIQPLFETNTLAPIYIAKHFMPLLKQSRGKFIVVSSLAGSLPAPTRSLYAASKHAVNGFFNSLRIEVQQYGVSVCICLPASVDTGLRESAVDATGGGGKKDGESKLDPETCAREIIRAGDLRKTEVYIPSKYWVGVVLRNFVPGFVDGMAAKKYGFAR
ncbi:uncharacterized protein SPPG_06584 [Spizellomyces punctatus DAOM BR117]|uniref:Short chain dehydrogenase n=1 Tax=Spizellomyces punctatus (strain DAOM BR117) TaxID=645134 RepID=A0A0L0H9G2_SPIPD|nr:uncharacterized protein SPPG_06584 [Spizellomyces punctatus DAOM BR117]KNC98180.1 hypothetical protein SPPG_06584 [Spizellomyces punctatus DAOM BR117]|eukprot:XP_016606220.1 hypothetical protein SPPG_06584 [Spizellomyces punctatus DAOM BR117]